MIHQLIFLSFITLPVIYYFLHLKILLIGYLNNNKKIKSIYKIPCLFSLTIFIFELTLKSKIIENKVK